MKSFSRTCDDMNEREWSGRVAVLVLRPWAHSVSNNKSPISSLPNHDMSRYTGQRSFSWVQGGSSHQASRLARPLNAMITPQERQNVHLASPVQELAVQADFFPGTHHAHHEASIRVSPPPIRPFVAFTNILGQHSDPARDMGLPWKHHRRHPRGPSLRICEHRVRHRYPGEHTSPSHKDELIFAQDLYQQPVVKLVEFIVAACQDNPNINLEVFVHKAEKLQEDDKIGAFLRSTRDEWLGDTETENFRQIHERVMDRLVDESPEYEQVPLNFHLTSVYDYSLQDAFSRVIHKLIDSLPYLENLLNVFCAVSPSPHTALRLSVSRF